MILAELTDGVIGPWTNLTAVGTLIVVVIYLITKGLPSMLSKFSETLEKQRNDYRDEMRLHREESTLLIRDGHEAINNLSKNVQQLTEKLAMNQTKELAG